MQFLRTVDTKARHKIGRKCPYAVTTVLILTTDSSSKPRELAFLNENVYLV